MRIQQLLAGVTLAAAMNVVYATSLIVGVDPATGESRFYIGSGAAMGRHAQSSADSSIHILPLQQIQILPGEAGAAADGASPAILVDLDTFVADASPAIIEAIIQNKAAIDQENAAFIAQQQALLAGAGQTQKPIVDTPEGLDRIRNNLDNLVGNIVNKAIEQGKVDADRMRQLIDQINQKIDKKIDLGNVKPAQLSELEKAKRAQLELLEAERKKKQEAEKLKREQLKKQNEELQNKLKEQLERQKAEREKAEEAAKKKAAEEQAKKLGDQAAKAAFEAKQKALAEEKQKQEEAKKKAEEELAAGAGMPEDETSRRDEEQSASSSGADDQGEGGDGALIGNGGDGGSAGSGAGNNPLAGNGGDGGSPGSGAGNNPLAGNGGDGGSAGSGAGNNPLVGSGADGGSPGQSAGSNPPTGPMGGSGVGDRYDPNAPIDTETLRQLVNGSRLPPITPLLLAEMLRETLAAQSDEGAVPPNPRSDVDENSEDKLLRDFVEQVAALVDFPYIAAGDVSALPPSESLTGEMSAAYNGRLSGAFGDGTQVGGAMSLNVIFNEQHIEGSITFDGGKGTANIFGGWGDATNHVPMTTDGGNYDGSAVDVMLGGKFYGPKGQELGGSWSMDVLEGARMGQSADGQFATKQ